MKNWLEYWELKGRSKEKDIFLVSGYDVKLSKMTEKARENIFKSILKWLDIKRSDKVLEVGCGAGLWLIPLSKIVRHVVGIDASKSMLKRMPKNIKTYFCEANKLPFADNSFDKVFCFSVFQYFPNYKYATKALKEMYRVCKTGGRILICDIQDIDKKSEYVRRKKVEHHNLKRQYYSKDFFERQYENLKATEHHFKGYGNSRYRFNVLIKC